MKQLSLTAVAVFGALALSACGGGGGGTTTVVPTPVNNATNATGNAMANGNTSAGSGSAGSGSAGSTNVVGANADGTSTGSSSSSSTGSSSTPPAPSANLSEAIKKGMTNMQRGTFNGTMVTINNNTGTVSGAQTPNLQFDQFRIGSTRVLLLQGTNDKVNPVTVRRLTANDFPNGGFAPKNASNPGWIGSAHGAQNDPAFVGEGLQSFGRLRFGVYTDSNNTTHMFVHGNPAANTNIFGGKTFRGSAIIGKDGNYQGLPQAVTAKIDSALTKVDVSIKTDKTTLNFGGNLDVASKTFAGTQGGVETRGGLFGEDSIGGFFNVTEGVHKGENGVYGASSGRDVREAYGN